MDEEEWVREQMRARVFGFPPTRKTKELFYTEKRLAPLLNIHRTTLYRWRKRGWIDHVRFGRFVYYGESHIYKWLSERAEGVGPFGQVYQMLWCMRCGHSPFSIHAAYKCLSPHHFLPEDARRFIRNNPNAKLEYDDEDGVTYLILCSTSQDDTLPS